MPDTTNLIEVCGSAVLNTTVFPDTVLQTLDRRVGKDDLFFGREMFARSVRDWNGIPAIYQPDGIHPTDFKAVAEDPATAAKAVGGKLVGSVSNPRIVIPGGARLMAELDIDANEEEIVGLWKQGKLFPSTAFTANSDGDRLVSPPVPNHVLLFPVETDVVVPGDPGAFVNTREVSKMTKINDDKKTCTAELPADGKKNRESVQEPASAEVPANVEAAVSDLAGEVADKTEDVAELMGELKNIRAELDALKAQIADLGKMPAEVPATNAEPLEAPNQAADPLKEIDPEAPANELRTIAELTAENESLKAEIEALKNELETQKAAAERSSAELNSLLADAKFNRILDKLPEGAKATEDQLNTMRKAFDAGDVEALLNSVLVQNHAGATKAEGVPFTQSSVVEKEPVRVGDLSRPRKRQE